ncbi:MAG TPA: hypothetical protein VF532_17570, partial [Candidatus Angelobacter sp.]
ENGIGDVTASRTKASENSRAKLPGRFFAHEEIHHRDTEARRKIGPQMNAEERRAGVEQAFRPFSFFQ